MGLLNSFSNLRRWWNNDGDVRRRDDRHDQASNLRICRIEQLEARTLMAADLHLGSVFYEPHQGLDRGHGNTIQVSFDGGAAGSQLTHLVIDGNKLLDGHIKDGDVFFDTATGGLGVYGNAPYVNVNHAGFNITNVSVVDGGTQIAFDFTGFTAGMKLEFTIDTDILETATVLGAAATVDGNEFENSHMVGSFTAPHYQDITLTATYYDAFDENFAAADLASGNHLNLPPDSYLPNTVGGGGTPLDETVFTAGAVAHAPQVPLPASLAGRVWDSPNLNLVQDSGEPGIQGVNLTLLKWNGTQYVSTGLTQITDINGDYKFSNLVPGQYKVTETQPSGYFSVGDVPGQVGIQTRGITAGPDMLTDITLDGGEDSVHNDFAEAKPAELCGYVYHDRNNNGIKDPGEEGIPNVTVMVIPVSSLDPSQGTVTVHTDQNGFYCAEGLSPGQYNVMELQPTGWIDGLDIAGDAGGQAQNPGDKILGAVLIGGQAGENYNFGELLPAKISGKVYSDHNQDCIYNGTDQVLSGVTMQLLDVNNNVIGTTHTDTNGNYEFTNLTPGVYHVREIQPVGYLEEAAMAGTVGGTVLDPDNISAITIKSGDNGLYYDFCEIEPVSLAGKVWADPQGDCVFGPNDVVLKGVTMQLLNSDGQIIKTTVTDDNGNYSFDNLPPGTYSVRELQPTGYFEGGQMAGSAGGNDLVLDKITQIVLTPGTHATNYDFCELIPVSISGHVSADPNDDCSEGPGTISLSDVTMQLLDAQGHVIATTKTDSNGNYKFDNLAPGDYGVHEVQPTGYFQGMDDIGSEGGVVSATDTISQVHLGSGKQGVNYNFCEIIPTGIRGKVVSTPDGNCDIVANQTPIANVKIDLYNADGVLVATTYTDENGMYAFDNLKPGTYKVHETQPDNFFEGDAHVGTSGGTATDTDTITTIVLHSAQLGLSYDFCEVEPVALSGYVYQDGPTIFVPFGQSPPSIPTVRDGTHTSDDTPLQGIVLHLSDSAGNVVHNSNGVPLVAITDANGFYEFTNLPPGLYTVVEGAPAGYIPGLNVTGSTGGIAINRYNVGTLSILNLLSTLSIDGLSDALVRIPVPAGQNSINNNFSVVRIVELPPPPPPPHDPPPLVQQFLEPHSPILAAPVLPPPEIPVAIPPVYDAIHAEAWTWHLSVVNGGSPRSAMEIDDALVKMINTRTDVLAFNGNGIDLHNSTWILNDGTVKAPQQFIFGIPGAIPVTGDFAGDGITRIGVYVNGEWFIDMNGNGVWDAGDLYMQLGSAADKPVVGDWDGDGKADIGIFGPEWALDPRHLAREGGLPDPHNPPSGKKKNMPPLVHEATNGVRAMKLGSQGKIRADLIDHVFEYGSPGDVPVAGDWDGSGITRIGVFRQGKWYLDMDGNGKWSQGDVVVEFGEPGDRPIVGDWTGDGISKLGVYRKGKWILDTNNNRQIDALDKVFELGGPDDIPVAGDWDGSGKISVGVYHQGVIEKRVIANP